MTPGALAAEERTRASWRRFEVEREGGNFGLEILRSACENCHHSVPSPKKKSVSSKPNHASSSFVLPGTLGAIRRQQQRERRRRLCALVLAEGDQQQRSVSSFCNWSQSSLKRKKKRGKKTSAVARPPPTFPRSFQSLPFSPSSQRLRARPLLNHTTSATTAPRPAASSPPLPNPRTTAAAAAKGELPRRPRRPPPRPRPRGGTRARRRRP